MSTGGATPGPGLLVDTTLADLQVAWPERMQEGAVLEAAGHLSLALVFRLYALEIRLKALICRRLGLNLLPKHCKTHDLNELVIFTGLRTELEDPANSGIRKNWDDLAKFSKDTMSRPRYLPDGGFDASERDILLKALDDQPDGVWTWLSNHP